MSEKNYDNIDQSMFEFQLADDSASEFDKAQKEMKEVAMNDEELLSQAQQRAKILIEEKIIQLSSLNRKDLNIVWEYEQ